MLTDERIAEIFQELLDTREQFGCNNSDVIRAIKAALVENEAVVAAARAVDNLQKIEHEVAGIEEVPVGKPAMLLPFFIIVNKDKQHYQGTHYASQEAADSFGAAMRTESNNEMFVCEVKTIFTPPKRPCPTCGSTSYKDED